MAEAFAPQAFQERIALSELGKQWINDPLMNQDVWSLLELGYSQEECRINGHYHLYFHKFSLPWLKRLTQLTIKASVRERYSLGRIIHRVGCLNHLDRFLCNYGYTQPESLTEALLHQFISKINSGNRQNAIHPPISIHQTLNGTLQVNWKTDYAGEFICPQCNQGQLNRFYYSKGSVCKLRLGCDFCHQVTYLTGQLQHLPISIHQTLQGTLSVNWAEKYSGEFICPQCNQGQISKFHYTHKQSHQLKLGCNSCSQKTLLCCQVPPQFHSYRQHLVCPNPLCHQIGPDGQKGWIYKTFQTTSSQSNCRCYFCHINFHPNATSYGSWVGYQQEETLLNFCFDDDVWDFRQDMIPADGEGETGAGTNKIRVRLLDDNLDTLHNTVVIAGCAPVISLWARATERWHPQLRVQYNFANSMAALHSLCRGEAHIAGMHLYDPETGEYNTPFVRDVLAGREAVLITLGVWEEGLLLKSGNPMGIRTVSDLVAGGATIVNREIGSGSRMLLEQTLQKEQIPFDAVQGFDNILRSHQDVAQAVVRGVADAGMSTASVATAFGLGFIPLHQSRYDLVILKEYLEEAPVQQLLSTLGHRMVHSQFEILGGYDISKIGEVVATV